MRLINHWIPALDTAHQAFKNHDVDAQSARQAIMQMLDQASANAIRAGYTNEQAQQALFATVSFIDEQAMSGNWHGSAQWRLSPLQRHYFQTTRAGSDFFERLNQLPEEEIQIREVFAVILVAGFQGVYTNRSASELTTLRHEVLERVGQELGLIQEGESETGSAAENATDSDLIGRILSHSQVTQPTSGRKRMNSTWRTIAIIVIPILMIVALYLYLYLQVDLHTERVLTPLLKGH